MVTQRSDIRIVVIGDHNVGKTTMIQTYFTHDFSDAQIPSIKDRCIFQVKTHNLTKQAEILDTMGMKAFEHDRLPAYAQADVILLCFSVANPESFQNVRKVWSKEIKKYASNVPVILVGTKVDKFEDEDLEERHKLITSDKAKRLKDKLKFNKYISCSARNDYNIHKVFQYAIKTYIQEGHTLSKPKRKFCCISAIC